MLTITNLHKSYRKLEVLKGVDMHIDRGEIKGLIGVNGAGKSTLIECVCGVKKYSSGTIQINGVDILTKRDRNSVKKIIGYMPQNFRLFNDLTVEENLGYLTAVYGIDRCNIDRVIDMCFLGEYRKTLAKNLSGGYRQLLSMAGAIIHSPKLLILDEPTASMDPIFRRRFWGIVGKCREENVTVLVITHYMEELVECDNFACLSGGKVSFNGTLREYKKNGVLNIEEILKKYSMES